jgi:hypothetical protein
MAPQTRDEALLGLTGVDDGELAARKLRSIRRLLLLTLACEAWLALRYVPYSSHPGRYGLVATALVACAIAGWGDRWARLATGVSSLLLLGVVASVFPDNANHQFLALFLLAILALAEGDPADADRNHAAALQAMRWLVVVGIFWAGAMKLYYGYFVGGEFLSWRIAHDPGFARVLGPLLPAAELARLVGAGSEVGAGPFRADAWALIAVSNITWLAEIVLPPLLLWHRTRRFAMVASIALFLAIQIGAREVFFGGLMIGLLLLFSPRDRVATATPWIGAVYLVWLLEPELSRWLSPGSTP